MSGPGGANRRRIRIEIERLQSAPDCTIIDHAEVDNMGDYTYRLRLKLRDCPMVVYFPSAYPFKAFELEPIVNPVDGSYINLSTVLSHQCNWPLDIQFKKSYQVRILFFYE